MKLEIISLRKNTGNSCITMNLDNEYQITNCFNGDTKLNEIVSYFKQKQLEHKNVHTITKKT